MAENRRDFLKRASGTTAALSLPALAPSASALVLPEDPPAARRRRRPGSGLLLELSGQLAGAVGSDFSGGYAFSGVVKEKVGADHIVHKHLSNVGYADIALSVGPGMSPAFHQWIQHMAVGFTRKDGSLIAVDYAFRERRRLRFTDALVGEVVFPAVDVASPEPVSMSMRIRPEVTRSEPGSGQPVSPPPGHAHRWLGSNFRLKIDGLEASTRHTLRVDALPLRVVFNEEPLGEIRDYQKEPAYLEVPNLVFTVPEAEAQDLVDWVDWFIVRGNCGNDDEKSGTLEYLAADRTTVLFTLRFGHLGIFRLAPAPSEGTPLLKAEMYCETLDFEAPNA